MKHSFQLQVVLQSNVPQPDELYEEDDDVDAALSELQVGPPMDICNNNTVYLFLVNLPTF